MLKETISQAISKGLIKTGTIIVDSTHTTTNARPKTVTQVLRDLRQHHTIVAHALLEAVSVMLHKNSLTCAGKPANFLYNLTKNLAAQSAHPNCAVVP